MSTSVLPQLLEVDSELLAQTTALESQLNELQEKRKGIQTVIAMFESGDASQIEDLAAAVPVSVIAESAPATGAPAKSAKSAAKSRMTKTKTAKTAKTAQAAQTKATAKPKATRGRPAKVKADRSAATESAASTKKATGKRSGRTANWQKYVQDSYSKAPLPDVIVGVLQAKPDTIFKIADVMNAVFKEDMPQNHFLKARNRVSNILSAGARDGDWYRGRGGTYSVSEKAIKVVS